MGLKLVKFRTITYPCGASNACRYYTYVESVSWSPDGKYLVATANDCTVRIFNIKSGRRIKFLDKSVGCSHLDTYAQNKVAWSPRGNLIAVGCEEDGVLRIWNWKKDTVDFYDFSAWGFVCPDLWSPDGKYLVLRFSVESGRGKSDGFVSKVFNVVEGEFVSNLVGFGYVDAWTPDGKLAGRWGELVRFWNPYSGGLIKQAKIPTQKEEICRKVSPKGDLIAVSTENEIRVFGIENREILWRYGVVRDQMLKKHVGFQIHTISWSPSGKFLAVGSGMEDASVRIFESLSGQLLYDSGPQYGEWLINRVRELQYWQEQGHIYMVDEILRELDQWENLGEGESIEDLNWSPNEEMLAKFNESNRDIHLYKVII